MAGVNKVVLVGNLTADPDVRNLPSGDSVTNIRIAVNRNFKNKDGEKQEETEFVPVVCFGGLGKNVADFCSVGRQVYVEGRLRTSSWEDKESGQKRYKTEVIANDVQFLGSKSDRQPVGAGASSSPSFDDEMPF